MKMNILHKYKHTIFICISINYVYCFDRGMLQIQESESRQIHDLSGMWNFRMDNSPSRTAGQDEQWYNQQLYKVINGHGYLSSGMCR